MTNFVPNGKPNDSPLDALPVDASDWDEVPVKAVSDRTEDLVLDELELDELKPIEPELNELELDESAILNEQPDDLFFHNPEPRTADEDYTIRLEEPPAAIWKDDRQAARLSQSYYETYHEPHESPDQEPLRFQQESFAAVHERAHPTLPLPDNDRAQIKQKLWRQEIQRLSLREIFGFTTLVAVALAAASWMPLNLYTLLLGCVTFGLLIAILKRNKPGRYIWVTLVTLLVIYIGSIIITIIRLTLPNGASLLTFDITRKVEDDLTQWPVGDEVPHDDAGNVVDEDNLPNAGWIFSLDTPGVLDNIQDHPDFGTAAAPGIALPLNEEKSQEMVADEFVRVVINGRFPA